MEIHQLHRQQWIQRPLEEIYEFFERPENLRRITPPSLDFRLLTPPPITMQQGRILDYTIRFMGLPLRWRSVISVHQPPACFVDEQLKGPYSFWFHRHVFKRDGNGTHIIDEVYYALPIWIPKIMSSWINNWLVRPRLEAIFDYRRDRYKQIFSPQKSETRARQTTNFICHHS